MTSCTKQNTLDCAPAAAPAVAALLRLQLLLRWLLRLLLCLQVRLVVRLPLRSLLRLLLRLWLVLRLLLRVLLCLELLLQLRLLLRMLVPVLLRLQQDDTTRSWVAQAALTSALTMYFISPSFPLTTLATGAMEIFVLLTKRSTKVRAKHDRLGAIIEGIPDGWQGSINVC